MLFFDYECVKFFETVRRCDSLAIPAKFTFSHSINEL